MAFQRLEIHRVHVHPSRLLRLRDTLAGSPRGPFGRLAVFLRRALTAALLLSERRDDWCPAASAEGRRLVAERGVTAVWTTSAPYRSASIGYRFARVLGLPWIADLRDSVAKRTGGMWADGPAKGWMRWVQRRRRFRALREADAVCCVTPQEAAVDAASLRRHVHVIPSGFDEAEWRHLRKRTDGAGGDRRTFRVLYAGRLYPGLRGPDPFLAGVRRYLDGDGDRRTLRLAYLGPSADGFRSAAQRFGLVDLLSIGGSVPPHAARRAMIEADLLLLLVSSDGESGVPGGKFYEYLAAGPPILAVPGTDEYVNGVLARTGAGRWASDPAEIASILRLYVDAWRTGGIRRRSPEEVLDHSWSARAQELADLLDAVTGVAQKPLAPSRGV